MNHKKIREIFVNSGLVLCSLAFLYLILELVVFRFFMQWLPLRTYGILDPGIRIFAQSSKKATIPKDYVLLLGDSLAIGLGDWFLKVNKNINPEFNSAHLIHNQTGKDVINFGYAGADSMRAMISYPQPHLDFAEKTLLYELEHPEYIIVYFFEGNDIDDNVNELNVRFKPVYDFDKVYDQSYFQGFLEEIFVPNHSIYHASREFTFWDNFFVAKYIKALILNFRDVLSVERTSWPLGGYGSWMNDPNLKREDWQEYWSQARPMGTFIRVLMNDQIEQAPDHLLGPGLELSIEEIKLGVYVFDQSLLHLKEQFPDSKIGVVYVPSTLASYHLTTEYIWIQPYFSDTWVYEYSTELVLERTRIISSLIEEVVKKHNVGYLDLKPFVLMKTASQFIHGPVDWTHYNKKGHQMLSEAVIQLMNDLDNADYGQ